MSVRAYKITFLELGDERFNLWRDEEVLRLLSPYVPDGINPLEGGYLEFALEDVQAAREHAQSERAKEVLDEMIADAKESEYGWARYWCL